MDTQTDSMYRPRMGRPKLWGERTIAKFATGTFERVKAVQRDGETRLDFFRCAVEKEIRRREALAAKRQAHKAKVK